MPEIESIQRIDLSFVKRYGRFSRSNADRSAVLRQMSAGQSDMTTEVHLVIWPWKLYHRPANFKCLSTTAIRPDNCHYVYLVSYNELLSWTMIRQHFTLKFIKIVMYGNT